MRTLLLILILTSFDTVAQHRWSITGGGGICVSFNTTESSFGRLPPKTYSLQRASHTRSFGLRYKINPHWLGTLDVRNSGLIRGIKTDYLVEERDGNGMVIYSSRLKHLQSYSPTYITLGASYQFWQNKHVIFSAEVGLGYMIIGRSFYPSIYMNNSQSATVEEQVFYTLHPQELRRGNPGAYIGENTSFQISSHSSLILTLQYYHGFYPITELRSEQFRYINRRTGVDENHEVVIRTYGRYAAAKVLYAYTF